MDKGKSCCFFGHRKIKRTEELTEKIRNLVLQLITEENVTNFLFGSRSQFDFLCREIVYPLREEYPHIRMVAYLTRSEKEFLAEERAQWEKAFKKYVKTVFIPFDEIIYPERVMNAGKASYVERNEEMVNESDFIVFYYDENYKPEPKGNKKLTAPIVQTNSGTKAIYQYAEQKTRNSDKKLFNLYL